MHRMAHDEHSYTPLDQRYDILMMNNSLKKSSKKKGKSKATAYRKQITEKVKKKAF